jgi:fatty acid-binding protein DegV
MKKTCIVVDSSSGIKNGMFPDVFVIPLGVTSPDGKTFRDDVEISVNEVIKSMVEEGKMYKTSQPIPADILDTLDKLSKEYEEVLVLPIPVTLSAAINTFKMLASDFNNVFVFEQDMVAQLLK